MTAENPNERLRLFVAIPAREAVRGEMLRVQSEFRELTPRAAARWAKPEQFHLTLKFLGDVEASQVGALKESVQKACAGFPPLELRARGVGFFPNARSPRVIWVGISDGAGRLAELQARVEIAVRQFAAGPGAEKFVGHVTLGRFKNDRRQDIETLVRRAETLGGHDFGGWTAEEIEIIRSEWSPSGARHTLFAAFRLAGCRR